MLTCIHSFYSFRFIQHSALFPPEPKLVYIHTCLPMAPPDSNCSECKAHGAPRNSRSRLVVCAVSFIMTLPRSLESGTSPDACLTFSMFLLALQLSRQAALHLVQPSPAISHAQPDPPFLKKPEKNDMSCKDEFPHNVKHGGLLRVSGCGGRWGGSFHLF